MGLNLKMLPGVFAICRLAPGDPVPDWAQKGAFWSIAKTPHELSLLCEDQWVPHDVTTERGWRCLFVEGVLDFSLTGILLQIAEPLARAKISIFALSTFDTDYVLIKESVFAAAISALSAAGHTVRQ